MADNIHINLPDGSSKEFPKGTTALDIAKSISPRLADAALVAKTNGDLIDLTRPLEKDTTLRILTEKDPESLQVYRHSSAHLLAAAVLELFPETKLGHGPATESGFFYDFYRPTAFTPEDLEKIEKKMQELAQQNIPYAREFLPREDGLEKFKGEGDFMKCHFIEQFTQPDEKISIYKTGKFLDFCRGPHIPSTGKIKAFKLLNIAGAYWLGDEKNPQLQRIYGTSFYSKKDLDAYLNSIEEAKKRDHRLLGQQLDLFSIQELAGPGLIFWHPKGGIIRKEMEDWMRNEYIKRGYSLVYTPHVARRQLWQTSGHEGYYAQNMFDIMELDDAEYRMKPMNCPFHILIYKDSLKSYRDLPSSSRRTGNRLPLRALGRDARPAPRPRLYPGRRAHLLHARADRSGNRRLRRIRQRCAQRFRLRQIPDRALHLESGRPQKLRRQRRAVDHGHAFARKSPERTQH